MQIIRDSDYVVLVVVSSSPFDCRTRHQTRQPGSRQYTAAKLGEIDFWPELETTPLDRVWRFLGARGWI